MKMIGALLLLISCTSLSPESENLNRVGYKAAKKIERESLLVCQGIGGSVPEKIKYFSLTFEYPFPMTIEEGRQLLLNSLKISLETFQQDPSIQTYLQDRPFGINNLNISIFNESFLRIESNLISCVAIFQGSIRYEQFDLQTKRFVTIYEETYEEALQKCEAAL